MKEALVLNGSFTELKDVEMFSVDGGWSWEEFNKSAVTGGIGGAVGGAAVGSLAGGVGALPGAITGGAAGAIGGAVSYSVGELWDWIF